MKEFCKKHRLSTNSLSMNSEGRYVCTGPQNEEPGGEEGWEELRVESIQPEGEPVTC